MSLRLVLCAAILAVSSAARAEPLPADLPRNDSEWTVIQVETICQYRSDKEHNPAEAYRRCMRRNSSKIGKPKQAGETTELNTADKYFLKKAAKQGSAPDTTTITTPPQSTVLIK